MKILLLSPGQFIGSSAGLYPRLGLRILAGLTPPEHYVKIVEGHEVNLIAFSDEWDLVGLSVVTPRAHQAYWIADNFRAVGTQVVIGGIHATFNSDEAKQHADAVCIGEGEQIWHQILKDAQQRQLKPFYRSACPIDRQHLPSPRREPSDGRKYTNNFPVETGRGCPVHCAFCFVPSVFGDHFQPRAIDEVVQEIDTLIRMCDEQPRIVFSENLLCNEAETRQLCAALEGLRISFSVEGRFENLQDDEYLQVIRRAGCALIYVETKMVSSKKNPDAYRLYENAVKRIQDKGIELSINFTVGYDDHDASIYDDVLRFLIDHKLYDSYAQLLVPWPGSLLFRRLEEQKRIINRNWSNYDNDYVVFQPHKLTVDELQVAHFEFWQELIAWRRDSRWRAQTGRAVSV